MNWPELGLATFAITLPLGSIAVAIPLAIRARRLGKTSRPTLPLTADRPLVLPGTDAGRGLWFLYAAGSVLQSVTLVSSFLAAKLFPPAPGVAIVVVLALVFLGSYLDARTARGLELDQQGFKTGRRRVRWLHVTELGAQDDIIRYRVNRALVQGSHWRYWDGAVRNGWGVDTEQLLRLFETYRRQALDKAPAYLTGRREGDPT